MVKYKEIIEASIGTKVICVNNSGLYTIPPIIGKVTTLLKEANENSSFIKIDMHGYYFKKRDFRLYKEPLDIQSIYDEEQ